MMKRFALVTLFALGACNNNFDPASKVKTVRVLAASADKPYAKPGDTVTLSLLAYDGRKDPSTPMTVSWIPEVCLDPPQDLYYLCPLAPFGALPTGSTFTFPMPMNVIDRHPPIAGVDPYGLAIVYNIACAGHPVLLPRDKSNPQALPLGCVDDHGNDVGPDNYVVGLERVYAYADRTNANPILQALMFQGAPVDPMAGVAMDHCTASKATDCPKLAIDVVVPDASWEENPGDHAPDGSARHEDVWVDYYSTDGQFDEEERVLFDPVKGRITDSATSFYAPGGPGDGRLWAVVHDNRGGATWIDVPMHVR